MKNELMKNVLVYKSDRKTFSVDGVSGQLIAGTNGNFAVVEATLRTLHSQVSDELRALVFRHYSSFLRIADEVQGLLHDIQRLKRSALETRSAIASLGEVSFGSTDVQADLSRRFGAAQPQPRVTINGWRKRPDGKALQSAAILTSDIHRFNANQRKGKATSNTNTDDGWVQGTRNELEQLLFSRQYEKALVFMQSNAKEAVARNCLPMLLSFEPLLACMVVGTIRQIPPNMRHAMHPSLIELLLRLHRGKYACDVMLAEERRWLEVQLTKLSSDGRSATGGSAMRFASQNATKMCVAAILRVLNVHRKLFEVSPNASSPSRSDLAVAPGKFSSKAQDTAGLLVIWVRSALKHLTESTLHSHLVSFDEGPNPPSSAALFSMSSCTKCSIAANTMSFFGAMGAIAECVQTVSRLTSVGFSHTKEILSRHLIGSTVVPLLSKHEVVIEKRLMEMANDVEKSLKALSELSKPLDVAPRDSNTGTEAELAMKLFEEMLVGQRSRGLRYASKSLPSLLQALESFPQLSLHSKCVAACITCQRSSGAKSAACASSSFLFLFDELSIILQWMLLLLKSSPANVGAEQHDVDAVLRELLCDSVFVDVLDAAAQQLLRGFAVSCQSLLKVYRDASEVAHQVSSSQAQPHEDDARWFVPFSVGVELAMPQDNSFLAGPLAMSILNDLVSSVIVLSSLTAALNAVFWHSPAPKLHHLEGLQQKMRGFMDDICDSMVLFPFGETQEFNSEAEEQAAFRQCGNLHFIVLRGVRLACQNCAVSLPDAPKNPLDLLFGHFQGKHLPGSLRQTEAMIHPFNFSGIDSADEAALYPLAVQLCLNLVHFTEATLTSPIPSVVVAEEARFAESRSIQMVFPALVSVLGKEAVRRVCTLLGSRAAVDGTRCSYVTSVYVLQMVISRVFEQLLCDLEFWEEQGAEPSLSQLRLFFGVVMEVVLPILRVELPFGAADGPSAREIVEDCVSQMLSLPQYARQQAMPTTTTAVELPRIIARLLSADVLLYCVDEDASSEGSAEASTSVLTLLGVQTYFEALCSHLLPDPSENH